MSHRTSSVSPTRQRPSPSSVVSPPKQPTFRHEAGRPKTKIPIITTMIPPQTTTTPTASIKTTDSAAKSKRSNQLKRDLPGSSSSSSRPTRASPASERKPRPSSKSPAPSTRTPPAVSTASSRPTRISSKSFGAASEQDQALWRASLEEANEKMKPFGGAISPTHIKQLSSSHAHAFHKESGELLTPRRQRELLADSLMKEKLAQQQAVSNAQHNGVQTKQMKVSSRHTAQDMKAYADARQAQANTMADSLSFQRPSLHIHTHSRTLSPSPIPTVPVHRTVSSFSNAPPHRTNSSSTLGMASPNSLLNSLPSASNTAPFSTIIADNTLRSPRSNGLLDLVHELEDDLRSRLSGLASEFEEVKRKKAEREAMMERMREIEALLTSFPHASAIRDQLLAILTAPSAINLESPNTTVDLSKSDGIEFTDSLKDLNLYKDLQPSPQRIKETPIMNGDHSSSMSAPVVPPSLYTIDPPAALQRPLHPQPSLSNSFSAVPNSIQIQAPTTAPPDAFISVMPPSQTTAMISAPQPPSQPLSSFEPSPILHEDIPPSAIVEISSQSTPSQSHSRLNSLTDNYQPPAPEPIPTDEPSINISHSSEAPSASSVNTSLRNDTIESIASDATSVSVKSLDDIPRARMVPVAPLVESVLVEESVTIASAIPIDADSASDPPSTNSPSYSVRPIDSRYSPSISAVNPHQLHSRLASGYVLDLTASVGDDDENELVFVKDDPLDLLPQPTSLQPSVGASNLYGPTIFTQANLNHNSDSESNNSSPSTTASNSPDLPSASFPSTTASFPIQYAPLTDSANLPSTAAPSTAPPDAATSLDVDAYLDGLDIAGDLLDSDPTALPAIPIEDDSHPSPPSSTKPSTMDQDATETRVASSSSSLAPVSISNSTDATRIITPSSAAARIISTTAAAATAGSAGSALNFVKSLVIPNFGGTGSTTNSAVSSPRNSQQVTFAPLPIVTPPPMEPIQTNTVDEATSTNTTPGVTVSQTPATPGQFEDWTASNLEY